MYGIDPRLPTSYQILDPLCNISSDMRIIEHANLPGYRSTLIRDPTSTIQLESFQVDDLVMLLDPALRKRTIKDKKTARYLGPFKVVAIHPHNSYTLESESGESLLIHASRMRKFIPRYPQKDNVFWWVNCKDKMSEHNVILRSLD